MANRAYLIVAKGVYVTEERSARIISHSFMFQSGSPFLEYADYSSVFGVAMFVDGYFEVHLIKAGEGAQPGWAHRYHPSDLAKLTQFFADPATPDCVLLTDQNSVVDLQAILAAAGVSVGSFEYPGLLATA